MQVTTWRADTMNFDLMRHEYPSYYFPDFHVVLQKPNGFGTWQRTLHDFEMPGREVYSYDARVYPGEADILNLQILGYK